MSNEKLLKIFQEVLHLNETPDPGTLVYNEFPGWDSVAHMSLVAAIESEFDIMMDNEDILGMSSFDHAVKTVEKYNVA
jgi:acyl carrier protein